MKDGLFNNAMREYLRTTGMQWSYWVHNEYHFCIHLMNEFGISANIITDATWAAQCCHGGYALGADAMEAVFNCYLGYSRDLPVWKFL
jgi:hypothetical protein